MSKTKTRVIVAEQDKYDGGLFDFGASWEDGSLDRVIKSLQALRRLIPKQYRASARCEFSSTSGWDGCHYANIRVEYDRPATQEEIEADKRARAPRKGSWPTMVDIATLRDRNVLLNFPPNGSD